MSIVASLPLPPVARTVPPKLEFPPAAEVPDAGNTSRADDHGLHGRERGGLDHGSRVPASAAARAGDALAGGRVRTGRPATTGLHLHVDARRPRVRGLAELKAARHREDEALAEALAAGVRHSSPSSSVTK
ncbi:hypothetical protein [Streptomyces sp. NPDC005423]|uniref:hypothetical protein n=1 Tax=Streptomyces sp. NPDC005423 TaxID=3155343 RepID=UPI0033B51F48